MTIRVIQKSDHDKSFRKVTMTIWGATQAKAKFSQLLDNADISPQRIERRKKRYILLTEEQYAAHRATEATADNPFISGWEALAPSSGATFDVDFPRIHSKPRMVKF
jgi:hypothetical protein